MLDGFDQTLDLTYASDFRRLDGVLIIGREISSLNLSLISQEQREKDMYCTVVEPPLPIYLPTQPTTSEDNYLVSLGQRLTMSSHVPFMLLKVGKLLRSVTPIQIHVVDSKGALHQRQPVVVTETTPIMLEAPTTSSVGLATSIPALKNFTINWTKASEARRGARSPKRSP